MENGGILKTNSLGYDGKGQVRINKHSDLFEIWENLGSVECVLEEILEFKREISIMYFKSTDNSDGFFPISQNHHENGILRKTIAPTILNIDAERDLRLKTKKLSENLGLYEVNVIANYDADIIAHLNAPAGSHFARNEQGVFERIDFEAMDLE